MGRDRAPLILPLSLALLGGIGLGLHNVANAEALAPQWGQDLAFFTQLVHSAAEGGPWASPLLLEPQGFFAMVHTHLVLPLVVAAYALVPDQRVLLVAQGLFTGLCLWPAFRLAESVAREGDRARPVLAATIATLGLLLLSPLQAVGTADFRPSALFLPGLIGVFSAARRDAWGQALLWTLVAQAGREEASYLLLPAGLALCLLPWGPWRAGPGPWWRRALGAVRWRSGLAVIVAAVLAYAAWVVVKPQMFFHFDPRALLSADGGGLGGTPLPPDAVEARLRHLGRALAGGGLLGLLAPAPLVAGLPLFAQLAGEAREWTLLSGPGAHYHVSWLGFVLPAALAGAMRLPRRVGGALSGAVLLAALCALSFPQPAPREGPVEVRRLLARIPADAAVAADHDTVAALAGRAVLWNVQDLHRSVDARPYHWEGPWPLTLDMVDVVVMDRDHPLAPTARDLGFQVAATAPAGDGEKVLWTRAGD